MMANKILYSSSTLDYFVYHMEAMGLAYVLLGLVIGGFLGWMLKSSIVDKDLIRSEERIRAKRRLWPPMRIELGQRLVI